MKFDSLDDFFALAGAFHLEAFPGPRDCKTVKGL